MNSEQKHVLDLFCELAKKASFAKDSFYNNDLDKAGVRLQQAEDILRATINEFQNYCISQDSIK